MSIDGTRGLKRGVYSYTNNISKRRVTVAVGDKHIVLFKDLMRGVNNIKGFSPPLDFPSIVKFTLPLGFVL